MGILKINGNININPSDHPASWVYNPIFYNGTNLGEIYPHVRGSNIAWNGEQRDSGGGGHPFKRSVVIQEKSTTHPGEVDWGSLEGSSLQPKNNATKIGIWIGYESKIREDETNSGTGQ